MKTINVKGYLKIVSTAIKQHDSEILTGIGIVGAVSGAILAVKATPKAIILIEQKKKEKKEELTAKEKVSAAWKCYIPAVSVEAISILCLIRACVSGSKKNAALAAAYGLSETAFKEYQNKVVETVGEKKESDIRDAVAKSKMEQYPVDKQEIIITNQGDTLCCEALTGRYFKSDIEKIHKAENEINKMLLQEDYVSLNDLYDILKLPYNKIGNDIGWNINGGLIEFSYSSQLTTDGTPCLVLSYRKPPYYYYTSKY